MNASPARKRFVVPLALLALVAVAATAWWLRPQPAAAADSGVTGVVEAREYQVAPVLSARVAELRVREGDRVAAGDVLVVLDQAALALQVEQATAGVQAAQAAQRQAEDDDESDAAIDAARAKVRQAQATLDTAKVQQSYATVTAPHSGTVVTVATNVGQNAAPAKTLLTLIDPADTYVRVYVPEPKLGAVKVGQVVRVTLDAGPSVQGHVSFVASDAEFTPSNVETKDQRAKLVYQVRVALDEGAGALKPGEPATVDLS